MVLQELILRSGPPWGFRLYEHPREGLVVCKVRYNSAAEDAGLREGDHLVAINGIKTANITHADAVQIIDCSSFALHLEVQRQDFSPHPQRFNQQAYPSYQQPFKEQHQQPRQRKIETFYLDNFALRNHHAVEDKFTTTELQLVWEKENSPPPIIEPPAPDVDLYRPIDPNVTPISVQRLLTTYDAPIIERQLKSEFRRGEGPVTILKMRQLLMTWNSTNRMFKQMKCLLSSLK
ncbi:hypothetical protein Ciccas_014597 [Cichlidogyrus casuarinus]|uniref:PDZ domain-containing protein n=1 Tax=Cichlidogyrus casuarinus TaxID=1844966 RepID=A0ABD2PJF6_9PLAT